MHAVVCGRLSQAWLRVSVGNVPTGVNRDHDRGDGSQAASLGRDPDFFAED